MTLKDIRDLLVSVLPEATYHYYACKQQDKYIVWAEDGEANSGYADNRKTNQVLQGTIDYFTKEEFDPNFDLIQTKLNDSGIAFRINSIQHEENTGYIHYEWVWETI